ncbi:GTPase IMAP family member 7-like [Perca fluviatilis]|uniref:GTPase IMAP family member 7-like n=1 Tax=Perca fluviatilis TaxID=8168 RepID=UPI001963D272|nr:GTPase IMAP family member 7-like [Perca fluviatilis]
MVGVGKSFSGNTILGNDLFNSKRSLSAVTEKCQKEMGNINNQNVVVVDTPGLLSIDQTEEEIMREIKKSINLAEPGPHVFLIVLSVKEKYTKKEEDMVKSIRDTFGKNTMDYTMVLFTHGEEGTKIENFFSGNKNLHELIKKCKYGYHLLDNPPEQVPELLKKINDKVQAAKGRYYTAEMLQEAETALKVRKASEGGTQPNQAAIQTAGYSGMGVGCLFGYLAGEGQITSTIGAPLGAVGGGLLCAAVAERLRTGSAVSRLYAPPGQYPPGLDLLRNSAALTDG